MSSEGKRPVSQVEWLGRLWWARYATLLLVVLVLLAKWLHGQAPAGDQDQAGDQSSGQTQTTVAGPSVGPAVDPNAGSNMTGVMGGNGPRLVRLSDVEGAVEVMSTDNTEFPQVVQNMPLLEGMRVATPTDARAEIEFEDGSVVRLAPNSAVTLDKLGLSSDGDDTQLTITNGLVYLELRAAEGYSYRVAYGDGTFAPVQNSTVRVNMDIQPAELAVFAGAVSVERPDGTKVQVLANESLKGDASDPDRYFLAQSVTADSWDQWNQDRDDMESQAAADQTTARNNFAGDNGYGWSDLDEYGNWYPVPGQGLMWQPAVYTSDFDPYGAGYWMDYPGYGYEWVSAYPWGWTPFYCGSWDFVDGFGWGWVPVGGCRGYGYGFGGGFIGARTNIVLGPSGYHYPKRPEPPIHGPHPLITVGGGRAAEMVARASVSSSGGQRSVVYRGELLAALPAGANAAANGARGDYPVNSTTHAPVVGRVPKPAPSTPTNNARPAPGNYRPGNGGGSAPHYSPPPRPSYSSPARSGGGSRR